MKLSVCQPDNKHHNGMVYSVCWNPLNSELISIGDDKCLSSWQINNESSFDDGHNNVYNAKKLMDLSHHCIASSWCPDQAFMAAAFTDGTLKIISFDKSSSTLKIDKIIDNAHHGAITCLSWNYDGSTLITGGEDGIIKQWSRSGNLRAKLFQSTHAIHSVSWSPNNQNIVYASDKYVGIQPVQGKNKKSIKWKAHSGIVLCIDWNPINNLLITGGEDCYYRIWDEFGRLLYSSKIFNYPITSLSWAPNGQYFSIGSYNTVLLCDYQGWIYETLNLNAVGSALSMNWSQDSTNLGIGCANGEVLFGQITNRTICYKNYYLELNERNQIVIKNILSPDFQNVYETLEFNESVINFSINFNYLIVITTKQCHIYQIESLTTPQIIPLSQGTVIYVILQTASFFILINNISGINIIGYEGKTICQFRIPSVKPKLLNAHNICCTNDTLSIIDTIDTNAIHIFDPFTSTPLSDDIKHTTNIIDIALNVSLTNNIRKIAFIDNNKDLFITKVHQQNIFKLKTIVDSIAWHPDCDILLALSDKQLVIWYYPDIVWCDTDLIEYSLAKIDTHNIGNNAQIISIHGSLVTIRKQNGDQEIITISPLPLSMFEIIREGKWNKALRLCHICNDKALWASLTGIAIDNNQIEIALQGLTALEETDKILFLKSIQQLPLQSQKEAELSLYRKNIKNAENILLQNDLIYRAIELNMRLFKWKRALEIAINYNIHIDTVIGFRSKYLQNLNKTESIDAFIKYKNENEINIDWNVIDGKCKQEIDKEYDMAGMKIPSISNNLYRSNLSFLQNNSSTSSTNSRKELEQLLGMVANVDESQNNLFQSDISRSDDVDIVTSSPEDNDIDVVNFDNDA